MISVDHAGFYPLVLAVAQLWAQAVIGVLAVALVVLSGLALIGWMP